MDSVTSLVIRVRKMRDRGRERLTEKHGERGVREETKGNTHKGRKERK